MSMSLTTSSSITSLSSLVPYSIYYRLFYPDYRASLNNDRTEIIEKYEIPSFSFSKQLNEKIILYNGDITRLEVDAIVNSANGKLLSGGGICGAIFRAAGSKLKEACDNIPNGCNTGQTVITPGFNLPAKYILHSVGPKNESDASTLLVSCYNTILNLCRENNIRTVALCCISTGMYGFSNLIGCLIALQTTRTWLDSDEKNHFNSIDKIVFCTLQSEDKLFYDRFVTHFFPLTDLNSNKNMSNGAKISDNSQQASAIETQESNLEHILNNYSNTSKPDASNEGKHIDTHYLVLALDGFNLFNVGRRKYQDVYDKYCLIQLDSNQLFKNNSNTEEKEFDINHLSLNTLQDHLSLIRFLMQINRDRIKVPEYVSLGSSSLIRIGDNCPKKVKELFISSYKESQMPYEAARLQESGPTYYYRFRFYSLFRNGIALLNHAKMLASLSEDPNLYKLEGKKIQGSYMELALSDPQAQRAHNEASLSRLSEMIPSKAVFEELLLKEQCWIVVSKVYMTIVLNSNKNLRRFLLRALNEWYRKCDLQPLEESGMDQAVLESYKQENYIKPRFYNSGYTEEIYCSLENLPRYKSLSIYELFCSLIEYQTRNCGIISDSDLTVTQLVVGGEVMVSGTNQLTFSILDS